MGNLCSTSKDSDAFSQPGRTLSSAPPQQRTSRPPKTVVVGGPPRTLGGSGGGGGGYGTTSGNGGNGGGNADARRAAAEAAERRAREAQKPGGKLAQDLAKQKAQTRSETLAQASYDERRARESDSAAETRAYN